ncbi:tyrosine-protein kinase JAK2-like [Panonychus citri]|uniref:tyrosine-protein kinase JAK2-like n=1 Tax=Panonychus citri TaxID=50023 RepID=UPI002307B544|nr:tyrosine-protein kinase JAK2-like [Panonychus citri]
MSVFSKFCGLFRDLIKSSSDGDIALDDYLIMNRKRTTIKGLLVVSLYVVKILDALSKAKIAHGLIKCSTFYATKNGLIRIRERSSKEINKISDCFWLSPERFDSQGGPTVEDDIFALGITLWEIFSFGRKPNGFAYQLLCPPSCPSEIWKIIQQCWSQDPCDRPKPNELWEQIIQIELNYSELNDLKTVVHNRNDNSPSLWTISSKGTQPIINDGKPKRVDPSWVIPVNRLQIVKTFNGREAILGTGAYGEVLKARYPADSNNFVAVKRINRRAKERNGQRIITDVEREFQIMTKVFHPNIVSIIGIVKDPEIMLVMEFMELGSLAKFLRKLEPNELKSIPLQKYAHDIVSGMEYLEKMRIVHRDLAARNILMSSTDTVKISDFGLAQSLGPGEDVYFVRTPRYLPFKWYAPESIRNDPIFTHKSDVWSFGVTLWELFSLGAIPDYPVNPNSIADLLKFLEGGGILSKPGKGIPNTDKFWAIMVNCWKINSSERPNFTQLKNEIAKICNEIQLKH